MVRDTRILLMFALLGLSIPDFGGTAQSRATGLSLKQFVISGRIGVAGVRLEGLPSVSGLPVTTDENGAYLTQVRYGWAGTVRPVKDGYVFEPPSRTYAAVKKQCEGQDYTATLMTFTISNVLKAGDEPIPGVRITAEPGGYSAETDSQGRYRIKVPYGWSGRLVLFADDVEDIGPFENVTSDIIDGKVTPPPTQTRMVTISDVIKACNEPIQGVTVTARPGGYAAVTDSQGRYNLKVPYGWSGSLSFSKPDLEFVGEVQYLNVTADIIDRKSVPADDEWPPFPSEASQGRASLSPRNVLVIPTTGMTADEIAATAEDLRMTLQILRREVRNLQDHDGPLDAGHDVGALYLQGSSAIFTIEADLTHFPRSQATTFEQFKDRLLDSLKHAANVHIDPNEQIILTLVARNRDAGRAGTAERKERQRKVYGESFGAMTNSGRPALSTTVLTMQARKADVDAFAQGILDFDQFRRKVKSIAY